MTNDEKREVMSCVRTYMNELSNQNQNQNQNQNENQEAKETKETKEAKVEVVNRMFKYMLEGKGEQFLKCKEHGELRRMLLLKTEIFQKEVENDKEINYEFYEILYALKLTIININTQFESEEKRELKEYEEYKNYQNNSHYINGEYMDNDEMCDYYKALDIWDKI